MSVTSRPNVLYIHSHDTGRYIQPYGYAVPTPAMQRLAEEGVLFRQAFCAGPTCSPSRAGLLTGQCAHSAGMLGLAHRGFDLYEPRQHLACFLQGHGYRTRLVGMHHDGTLLGYDQRFPFKPEDPAAYAPIQELFAAPQERPFFLSVGLFETHRTHESKGFSQPRHQPGDGAADARYVMPPPVFPDTPQTRRDFADFRVAAARYDRCVGRVLELLDQAGLSGNTLVINTTDHGIAFPGMKCNLTDHGIGVMLLMRGPGGFTGGKVVDAMVSQVDVYPTLCDCLGLPPPPWLQGVSFLPLVAGTAVATRQELFAEVTFHAAYEPQRCIRTARHKYIRRYDDRQALVLPNTDEGHTKTYLLAQGWERQPREQEMLFDLVFDPQERHNLAADPAQAGVLADLRTRLDRWMQATADPLLRGPVPPPSGAKINDVDGRSADEEPRQIP